jgi:fibro-slime domain-containing protein
MKSYKLAAVTAASPILLLLAVQAHAVDTLTATYYEVSPSDPDFNTQDCCGVLSNNEVLPTLGPDGLPLYNATGYSDDLGSGVATPLKDVNSQGEITWWSTANSNVTKTGSGTITLPYSNGAMFPLNATGPNDANGFLAAVFTGQLDVGSTEKVSFTVGADDVAFVYLNGSIVCDLGGVHGDAPGTCTTPTLTSGDYSLEVFYADVHQTGAAFNFNITTADVTSTGGSGSASVPEPATLLLFGTGLLGLGVIRRRRNA